MMNKIDLHVHSNFSDGKDSVNKVLDLAKARGVKMLSFVDHDTNLTYNEALPYARRIGIDLVPGIEISAYDFKRKRKVHILGYNYDLDAPNIKKLTEPLLSRRHRCRYGGGQKDCGSSWSYIQAAHYACNLR